MNATATPIRVGLIVPSSNVTIETELPALFARYKFATFTFHSSRMRMQEVSEEELRSMNAQRERCVAELTDVPCDSLVYGCLVAIMAQGPGEHRRVTAAIREQLSDSASMPAIVTSADALIEALQALGARRVALVTPYMKPLAQKVVDYLEAEQIEVTDWIALEEPDNAAVARIPGERIMTAARTLNLSKADALILSACVQMPSLSLIEPTEAEFGLPVLSASTATAFTLLRRLDLPTILPGAGSLLHTDLPSRLEH
jgi:maleate isomerase